MNHKEMAALKRPFVGTLESSFGWNRSQISSACIIPRFWVSLKSLNVVVASRIHKGSCSGSGSCTCNGGGCSGSFRRCRKQLAQDRLSCRFVLDPS